MLLHLSIGDTWNTITNIEKVRLQVYEWAHFGPIFGVGAISRHYEYS